MTHGIGGLGVTDAKQQAELFSNSRNSIRNVFLAGEYSVALKEVIEVWESDCVNVERGLIADLRLTAARLYWTQKEFLKGFLAACHAMMTHPIVVGRFPKALLRQLGLVE